VEELTKKWIDDTDEMIAIGTVSSDIVFDRRRSENFRRGLSKQLIDSAWTFGKDPQEEAEARVGALETWRTFEPRDATEALLVAQMIGTHNAAMGYLHRASLETLPPEMCERAANKAVQLMGIFQNQAAALDKHRGKGQQKITVERVMVGSGGQAVVGNVETPALAAPSSRELPPPMTPIDPAPIVSPAIRVRSRTQRAND
jgi:hypothetical protein